MRLSDLDNRNIKKNVVLVQSNSTQLNMFLKDKLKKQVEADANTSYTIFSKEDLQDIKNLIGLYPPFTPKWFVSVDLDNINYKELGLKEIVDVIKRSTTVLFYCTCTKYATFKKFKDMLKNAEVLNVLDFYMGYLRRADFIYLYDAFVPSDKRLNPQMFNFVTQTYADKVDVLFDLFLEIAQGKKFTTRKAIIDVCGSEDTTPESYVFSLLKPLSGSVKGFKTVMKQRMKAGVELADGLDDRTFSKLYAFMVRNIDILIILKTLMISGEIYKDIPQYWVDKYAEAPYNYRLDKYQRHLWRLKTIPLSRLLLLRQSMGSKWHSDIDFLRFLYNYYNIQLQEKLKEVS